MSKNILDELKTHLKSAITSEELKILNDILSEINIVKEKPYFPIIDSIQINNLNTFHKLPKFHFGDGINAILGSTGAGKTSFLHSIIFALFGKMDYYDFSFFNRRKENGNFSSSITFNLENKTYKISREITGNSHIPRLFRLERSKQRSIKKGEVIKDWNLISKKNTVYEIEEFLNLFFHSNIFALRNVYDLIYLRDNLELENYILTDEIGKVSRHDFRREITYNFLGFNSINQILSNLENQITLKEKKGRKLETELLIFKKRVEEIDNINEKEIIDKISDLNKQIDDLTQKKNINMEKRKKLSKNSRNKQNELFDSELAKKRGNLQREMDKIKDVITENSNFRETIKKKKNYLCLLCNRKFTHIAKDRIQKNLCPNCGLKIDDNKIIEKSKIQLIELEKEYRKVNQEFKDKIKELHKIDDNIEQIIFDNKIIEEKIRKLDYEIFSLNNKLDRKKIKFDLNEQTILQKRIEENEIELVIYRNLLQKIYSFISNYNYFKKFIQKLNENFEKLQNRIFQKTLGKFSFNFRFISEKVLFANLSNGQQRLLDILFRISYMVTLVELKIIPNGFLILDNPEVKIDEVFYKELSKIVNDYSKNIKFIITAYDPEFIKLLNYKKLEEINSISREITNRQKVYFQKKMDSFQGGER